MRKWILATGVMCVSLWGQITLERSDFLSVGDQITQISADPGSLEPGGAGPSQLWDFRSIVDDGQTNPTISGVEVSSTAYSAQFPNANLAFLEQPDGNDNFAYYLLNNQEFTLQGVAGTSDDGDVIVVYDDTERHIAFPFTYGDKIQDTFHAVFTSNGVSVERTGNSETEADGYGTLMLPQGNFENVLRFKTEQTMTDVTMGIAVETTIESYSWMVKGGKWPLMVYSHVRTTVPGQTIDAKKILFQGESSNSSSLDGRMLSHVTRQGGGFQTHLILKNKDASLKSVQLTPYNSLGQAGSPVEQTLDGNQFLELDPSSLFDADLSHLGIDGAGGVIVTTAFKTASGNGASAHIHDTEALAQEFIIYPGEWDVVFDGMALVNRGSEACQVSADQMDVNGKLGTQVVLADALAVGGKLLAVFGDHFTADPSRPIRIQTTQPCSALFLRGTPPGVEPAYLYANNPQPTIGTVRWIPHVTRPGGGFQTVFFIQNHSNQAQDISLSGYLSDGSTTNPVSLSIPAGSTLQRDHEALFGATEVSHFQISGSDQVSVTAAYKVAEGLGASAHVHESGTLGREFWIYPGESEYVFDGLAAINLGDGPAHITAILHDSTGTVLAQADVSSALEPFAKVLAVFGNLFPGMTGIIEIQSDQDIIPLFLRGTPPGVSPGYLFTNLPLP